MAVITAAAIAGAAALAGGAYSAKQSGKASTDQRHFAREMFQKQVALENSAHQRQVKDLRKAGLNPILSAQQSGAGTPSAMGYQPPQYRNIGAEAVQAATGAATASSNAIIQNEQGALAQENQIKVRAEVKQLGKQHRLTDKQVDQLTAVIQQIQLQGDQTLAETERVTNSAKLISSQKIGQDLKNAEQQIMMKLFNEHEVFKYLKYFGWEGAAAAQGIKIIKQYIEGPASANQLQNQSARRRANTRGSQYR